MPTSPYTDRATAGIATDDFLCAPSLVAWLQLFVRFPSEQTTLHEKDPRILSFIRECVEPLARQLGAAVKYDKMGNAIVEVGPKSGDSLLFVAYAMTHPGAKMHDPFSATVIKTKKGPAVRGRGVAEQKTALAALFGALATALQRKILKRRLSIVVLTAGETGRHDAIESVLPELECKPQYAVVCIGTDNRIAIGNKGRIDFDVIVQGKTAHSSMPWHGINAITGAQKLLQLLDGFVSGVPDHPHFGGTTLTATAIESSPKATHTVPDSVRITYDRRLLPGEDAQSAYDAIRKLVVLPKPWTVDCQLGPVMHANEISAEGKFMKKLAAGFASAGKTNPDYFYCNFALDAGYLARAGIEAVMLGPGEVDQFHSNEEHVLISDLITMSNVYYGIIDQCLGHNS